LNKINGESALPKSAALRRLRQGTALYSINRLKVFIEQKVKVFLNN